MATVTFDTLKFVERLKAAGVAEGQAKAMAEAQKEIFAEALDFSLTTKADILGLRQELKADIERLDRKLVEHDGEFKLIKFMLSLIVGGVVALILKSFF